MGFMDWLHQVYKLEDTPVQAAYKKDNQRMHLERTMWRKGR